MTIRKAIYDSEKTKLKHSQESLKRNRTILIYLQLNLIKRM